MTGPESGEVGEVLTFECSSGNSNPAANVSWVVDRRNVEANYTTTEQSEHGGFLTSSNISVVLLDTTRYKMINCYANNLALGEHSSFHASHRVTVIYPPDTLIVSGYRRGEVLLEGSVIRLKCSVMTGNPLPKLVWFRGSKEVEVQSTDELLDEDKNQLSVSSEISVTVDRNENGKKYKCKAEIEGKKKKYYDDLTEKVKLLVNFLPETVDITVTPEKLVENKVANLTCTSKPSNPAVDIIWHYNDKILPADGTLSKPEEKYGGFITSSFLLMSLTTEHVEGTVRCEARHNITDRSVLDSIKLDVEYSPKLGEVPEQVVEVGGNITFSVTAKANPGEIGYRWKQEGGAMVPTEGEGSQHSRWQTDCMLLGDG